MERSRYICKQVLFYYRFKSHRGRGAIVKLVNETMKKKGLLGSLSESTYKTWEDGSTHKIKVDGKYHRPKYHVDFANSNQLFFKTLCQILHIPLSEILVDKKDYLPSKKYVEFYETYKGTSVTQYANQRKVAEYGADYKKTLLHKLKQSRFKLVCFDFDGTLFADYKFSWKLIWQYLGYSDSVRRKFFRMHDKGLITYAAWVAICVDHFRRRHFCYADLQKICESQIPTKNSINSLRILHEAGIKTGIISGGLINIIEELYKDRMPDYKNVFSGIYANRLFFDENGDLTQETRPTPFDFKYKNAGIKELADTYEIDLNDCVFVGDDNNDSLTNNLIEDYPNFLSILIQKPREGSDNDSLTSQYKESNIVYSGDFYDVLEIIASR